jgi:cytochrome oxidase Cu insertion factor (SCO1/SenC/PrrC family)
MPSFRTVKADGTPFTEKNLQDGKFSVLVFNRGRW